MTGGQENIANLLKALFDEACSKGGLQYIFTLVRVEGMTQKVPDPFLQLRAALQAKETGLTNEELLAKYCSLATRGEPLSLVANLLNCIQEKPYKVSPFLHLYKGEFPDVVKPTPAQIAGELAKMGTEAGKPEIAQLISEAYSHDVLSHCGSGAPSQATTSTLQNALMKCRSFLALLLEIYFAQLLKYRDHPRLCKLQNFKVLELMVKDEPGLYGFRMHFSNGSSAIFARHPDSTECINVNLSPSIGFSVGLLAQLRDEWRVGDKRLYEIGLPGRYNKLGEWKPIIYPGNYELLEREALTLSEDDDVRGALFYMMCTGHRVIEFVVRTSIELPLESMSFGEKLHLWKCPAPVDISHLGQNVVIYDGWLELDSADAEYIRSEIAMIGVAVNRMAFVYGGAVDWRVKYRMTYSGGGYATPSREDLHVLDAILRNFPRTEDAFILDAAIDWFNRGRSSRNIFTTFLCYYIALESVAIAVAEGGADLGLGYSQESKEVQTKRIIKCIQEKQDLIYSENPARFVAEAYFDCVLSLKEKTKRVTQLVFGPEHKYLKALFEKRDGYSLNDIRGKLAHGLITLLDRQDESLVRSRVHEIAEISKEFLTRVIFLLKPDDPLPSWSRRLAFSMSAGDPRTCLVATTDKILPQTNWRIRSEWCE